MSDLANPSRVQALMTLNISGCLVDSSVLSPVLYVHVEYLFIIMPIRLVSRFKLDRVDFYGKQLFRQKTIAHWRWSSTFSEYLTLTMLVTVLLLIHKITEFFRRKHLEHVIESSYIDLIQWSSNSTINMTDSMVVFVNANAVYEIANKGDVLSLLCESDEIVHGSLKRKKYRINRNNSKYSDHVAGWGKLIK